MTPAEQTKRSYEQRPYPHPRGHALIRKRGNLPSTQWMLALGRPGLPPPQRLLVAGCGTGAEAFFLRSRFPKAEIVAVDFSPCSIALAQRLQKAAKIAQPIRFLVGDLTETSFVEQTGGEFDLITCHGVLSYLAQPGAALQNLGACLRPDGALYIGVNGAAHPATRLRPWLAGFGLAVDEMRDERRLRELLRLWDTLHGDSDRELATMPAEYLAGDVCGPHFNNWSLGRWRDEARSTGWTVAAVWILPPALRLILEDDRYRPLFPSGLGELAERLDQARPAGFHRILLRRAPGVDLDSSNPGTTSRPLHWTGLYSARLQTTGGSGKVTAKLHSPVWDLDLSSVLSRGQADLVRRMVASGMAFPGWRSQWGRSEAARRLLWLWNGLGIVNF